MNWLKSVADAPTIDALLTTVNEYLLQQPDESWSWVPRECRPQLVATEEDVHFWHRKLAAAFADATSPNIRMQDLCVFFVRASGRALELHSEAHEASPNKA